MDSLGTLPVAMQEEMLECFAREIDCFEHFPCGVFDFLVTL